MEAVPTANGQEQEAELLGQQLNRDIVKEPLLAATKDKVHLSNYIQDGCQTTFIEECHNEYEMVCEETSIEREKEQCEVVEEEVCREGVATGYEPACFQHIINHCDGVSEQH